MKGRPRRPSRTSSASSLPATTAVLSSQPQQPAAPSGPAAVPAAMAAGKVGARGRAGSALAALTTPAAVVEPLAAAPGPEAESEVEESISDSEGEREQSLEPLEPRRPKGLMRRSSSLKAGDDDEEQEDAVMGDEEQETAGGKLVEESEAGYSDVEGDNDSGMNGHAKGQDDLRELAVPSSGATSNNIIPSQEKSAPIKHARSPSTASELTDLDDEDDNDIGAEEVDEAEHPEPSSSSMSPTSSMSSNGSDSSESFSPPPALRSSNSRSNASPSASTSTTRGLGSSIPVRGKKRGPKPKNLPFASSSSSSALSHASAVLGSNSRGKGGGLRATRATVTLPPGYIEGVTSSRFPKVKGSGDAATAFSSLSASLLAGEGVTETEGEEEEGDEDDLTPPPVIQRGPPSRKSNKGKETAKDETGDGEGREDVVVEESPPPSALPSLPSAAGEGGLPGSIGREKDEQDNLVAEEVAVKIEPGAETVETEAEAEAGEGVELRLTTPEKGKGRERDIPGSAEPERMLSKRRKVDVEAVARAAERAAERSAARLVLLNQLDEEERKVRDSTHPLVSATQERLAKDKARKLAQLAKCFEKQQQQHDDTLRAGTETIWRQWADAKDTLRTGMYFENQDLLKQLILEEKTFPFLRDHPLLVLTHGVPPIPYYRADMSAEEAAAYPPRNPPEVGQALEAPSLNRAYDHSTWELTADEIEDDLAVFRDFDAVDSSIPPPASYNRFPGPAFRYYDARAPPSNPNDPYGMPPPPHMVPPPMHAGGYPVGPPPPPFYGMPPSSWGYNQPQAPPPPPQQVTAGSESRQSSHHSYYSQAAPPPPLQPPQQQPSMQPHRPPVPEPALTAPVKHEPTQQPLYPPAPRPPSAQSRPQAATAPRSYAPPAQPAAQSKPAVSLPRIPSFQSLRAASLSKAGMFGGGSGPGRSLGGGAKPPVSAGTGFLGNSGAHSAVPTATGGRPTSIPVTSSLTSTATSGLLPVSTSTPTAARMFPTGYGHHRPAPVVSAVPPVNLVTPTPAAPVPASSATSSATSASASLPGGTATTAAAPTAHSTQPQSTPSFPRFHPWNSEAPPKDDLRKRLYPFW